MGILGTEWTQLIRNNIDEFGSTVTVREIDKSFASDEYRILSETDTDHASIKTVVNVMGFDDELVKEGIFQAGDLMFFFKDSDSAYIVNGNRIQFNSAWYEINDVDSREISDSVYIIEARTKKV